jgi:hypothetical protein
LSKGRERNIRRILAMLAEALASPRGPDPEKVLREIGLTKRFSLRALYRAVEFNRGRTLRIKAAVLPPEYSALWIQTDRADYIVVAEGLPRLQQNQASVHEIAHMLLGHQPHTVTSLGDLGAALGLPARMQVLARSGYHYGNQEESEAEALATAICMRLDAVECVEPDERVARFQESLS